MDLNLIHAISDKIESLNKRRIAVIFIVTGPNGSGKTILTKRLLTTLPFHQTFNLGTVAKTIRFAYRDEEVTRLENFTNKKITSLFTPIIQFACSEYQKNGVNVIIDGVQVDTDFAGWKKLITGGVVLRVSEVIRLKRNQHPETHFNRSMELSLTDQLKYEKSDYFTEINNDQSKDDTFHSVLLSLSDQLDRQLNMVQQSGLENKQLLEAVNIGN